jgi:hypothetical protein
LTPSDLPASFPVKYPKAKCPTAYMNWSPQTSFNDQIFLLPNINNPVCNLTLQINTHNSSNLYREKRHKEEPNKHANLRSDRN